MLYKPRARDVSLDLSIITPRLPRRRFHRLLLSLNSRGGNSRNPPQAAPEGICQPLAEILGVFLTAHLRLKRCASWWAVATSGKFSAKTA